MSFSDQGPLVSVNQLVEPLPKRMAFERVWQPGPMKWSGRLGELCVEVSDLAQDQTVEGGFWHASRLVQAALDSGPNNKVTRVHAAAQFALGLYAGTYTNDLFDDMVKEFQAADIMDREVRQESDETIARATLELYGKRSFITAMHMDVDFGDSSILFLPLSPEGIAAGMQTFLHHQRGRAKSRRNGTALYPIDCGDQGPKLTPEERDMLREQSEDKMVVVFGTHTSDGSDMATSVGVLKRELEADLVFGYVNRDGRLDGSAEMSSQGKWWQKVDALPEAA